MKSFKHFLTEAYKHPKSGKFQTDDKHVVMTYGRMNPPHLGHMAVVNKVRKVADKVKGDHQVILSHSYDKRGKNPLLPHRKLQYARTLFGKGTNLSLSSKESPSIIHHVANLHAKGYNHLHVVAGADRVKEFKDLLTKYNGKMKDGKGYNFRSITVHSAGKRTGKSAIPASATGQRKAASQGNQDAFNAGLPKNYHPKLAARMMSDVKRGLK